MRCDAARATWICEMNMQGPRQHYANSSRRNSACQDEESIADRETAKALPEQPERLVHFRSFDEFDG